MHWTLIITAIGLGIAYASAPGAVNTEAIRRGVLYGGRSALLVETGSLIGDSLWAVLALTGTTFLAQHLAFRIVLGIVGSIFLLHLAWVALHAAFIHRKQAVASISSSRGHFTTGVVFGLANPVGLAFWSGLGGSVATSGAVGTQFELFFVGFFIGATAWCIGIAALIQWGMRWVQPATFRWINLLCGLALGYFGLSVLWTTMQIWF